MAIPWSVRVAGGGAGVAAGGAEAGGQGQGDPEHPPERQLGAVRGQGAALGDLARSRAGFMMAW